MLEKEFSKLGLTDNEREVYLAVLQAGKLPVHRVAAETGINRTTVYSIARKLAKLGLISEDLGAKVAYLYAEKPEAIAQIFARDEAQLAARKQVATEVVKELQQLPMSGQYSVPKIKFVQELDLNDYLYKQYPVWAESGKKYDNTWWGYHDSSFTTNYTKFIDWLWKHGPEGQRTRFFTNNLDAAEEGMLKKHPERQFVVLPEQEQLDSSLWIIGDYVIMGQTRNRPHYLVEINDPVFARTQRQLFKNLWDSAQK